MIFLQMDDLHEIVWINVCFLKRLINVHNNKRRYIKPSNPHIYNDCNLEIRVIILKLILSILRWLASPNNSYISCSSSWLLVATIFTFGSDSNFSNSCLLKPIFSVFLEIKPIWTNYFKFIIKFKCMFSVRTNNHCFFEEFLVFPYKFRIVRIYIWGNFV